jgi:hypothetical protein
MTIRFPFRTVAACVAAVVLAGACGGRGSQSRTDQVKISQRGPGMNRADLGSLQLPVPRTFDLSHVEPEHFATAFGKDPVRIFEFVRDHVAFEVYPGMLRGPRGTLLALAGNSIDRAALLGAMLQAAGHQIRYARGMLSDRDARDLVTSMWAERPQLASADQGPKQSSKADAILEMLRTSVKRDYTLIRDALRATKLSSLSSEPDLNALLREIQPHYWVQWLREGSWTDLDPSFGDASVGRANTKIEETLAELPETLHHQVTVRVKIEESTDPPSSRTVLMYRARAADLSAAHAVMIHMPENWQGPVRGLTSAISSVLEDTGRVKPALLIGEQVVMGEPFRQRLKAGGIGGVFEQLRGQGTRHAAELALGEWLEFEFTSPDGTRETVVREIFDLVGKAQRQTGRGLSPAEIQSRTQAANTFDVESAIHNLTFTSGRIDALHLPRTVQTQPRPQDQPPDLGATLQRLNIIFIALSDSIVWRVQGPDKGVVLFYPDSLRVLISELSMVGGVGRAGLDLRRSHVRAVAIGSQAVNVFAARIFRGVVEGTLERAIVEYVTERARQEGTAGPVMSTSTLFEEAERARVPAVLLPRDETRLDPGIPPDARARLQEEASQGFISLAPQRALPLRGVPRFAWWRIDARSGETLAVTDEGLHQAFEYDVEVNEGEGKTTVTVHELGPGGVRQGGQVISRGVYSHRSGVPGGIEDLGQDLFTLMQSGIRWGSTFSI